MIYRVKTVLAVMLVLAASQSAIAGQLLGGFAKAEISPKAGTDRVPTIMAGEKLVESVSDPLYVKALMLSDGDTRIAIVASDLSAILNEDYQALRKRLLEVASLDHLVLSASHTHSGLLGEHQRGPVHEAVEQAVVAAANNMVEVQLGASSLQVDESYNRIQKTADGFHMLWSNVDRVVNPPADQSLDLIRVRKLNGDTLLTLVNYNAHPVITMDLHKVVVSADYPGQIARALEQMEQGESMFLLGAAGEVNPYDAASQPLTKALAKSAQLGEKLAKKIATAFVNFDDYVSQSTFDLVIEQFAEPAAEVGVIRLTPSLAFGHFPGEYFSAFAHRIKQESPFEHTVFVSMANGYIGYVPTHAAVKTGGFGTGSDAGVATGDVGDAHVSFAIGVLKRQFAQLSERF